MAIRPEQRAAAASRQHAAAHDNAPQIRLVAGPGTGKSFAIEERVSWLLSRGVLPDRIFAISFTRAAARDLRDRIRNYGALHDQPSVTSVSVSTLHSLALRTLRAAGLLTAYPVSPLVMDYWELENVLDAEFSKASGYTPSRCELIRREYEAFWGTGDWLPPNYIPPEPPITQVERDAFGTFHSPRTQTYSCVLPGEVVRACVNHIQAGTLDPVTLLGIEHLIVDEYQDLNPCDVQFTDALITGGVTTMVAGDDDQSIYSFRFGSPAGIQSFHNRHATANSHTLSDCFRCTPSVVGGAVALIGGFAQPDRIPKTLDSLYSDSAPPNPGIVHRWQVPDAITEARIVAQSCRALIDAGVEAHDILILLSNSRQLGPTLKTELSTAQVTFEAPRVESFLDEDAGRFLLAALRIVCNRDDYVAHRVLLGARPGVGPGTCHRIAGEVVTANLNYRDIFYAPLPAASFSTRSRTALNGVREVCAMLSEWTPTDTLNDRDANLLDLVRNIFGTQKADELNEYITDLPGRITLEELRDYLWADTDEQQALILQSVYQRLNEPLPDTGLIPQKVRVMTMHGAKGLSARIVFIPGLEESILPGARRQPYPGLVLEAARLLYVSITRARAVCILSYARRRMVFGRFVTQVPSRFLTHTGGPYVTRAAALTANEVASARDSIHNL